MSKPRHRRHRNGCLGDGCLAVLLIVFTVATLASLGYLILLAWERNL